MFCIHEILNILSDKPIGTSEVAERLGCHYQTAYKRLIEMHENGEIDGEMGGKQDLWLWSKKKEV